MTAKKLHVMVEITPEQALKVHAAIHERTVEEGDCLLWTGACASNSKSAREQPVFWLDGQTRPMRRLAYVAYGRELIASMRVTTSCGNDRCLCEQHLRRKTQSEALMGHQKSLGFRVRIAGIKQAASKLDWDKVREIRGSDLSNEAFATELGVHRDTIAKVRAYTTWRDLSSPFAGLTRKLRRAEGARA